MTMKEYYDLLEERWERVNKSSRDAIHEYNEWKRELRQLVDEEAEKNEH